MNKGLMVPVLVGVIVLGLTCVSGSCQDVGSVGLLPNPFDDVLLEKESFGATMRHPFHHMRQTWDRYFQVWPKPRDDHQGTTLEAIRSEPEFFIERNVEFDVIWNGRGAFYKQLISPFHRDQYVNFSCWSHDIELWDPRAREDIVPFFYVEVTEEKLIRRLEKNPKFTLLHLWAKVVTVGEGHPWMTITDFEVSKDKPFTVSSLRSLELAWKLKKNQQWRLAASKYQEALGKELPYPAERQVYEAIGKCLLEAGDYAAAREALIRGLLFYGNNRIQLRDGLLKDSKCLPALMNLVRADMVLENNREAKQGAELVISLEPFHAVAHAELGLAKARLGDFRGGLNDIAAAERLVSGGKLPEARRNRAHVYILKGDWKGAEQELAQAILQRPDAVQYHMELGNVYVAMADGAKAQVEFENATRLTPGRPEPFHFLAVALKMQGDAAAQAGNKEDAGRFYALALEKIQESHQKDDEYKPAYLFHAELLKVMGKEEEAKKVLEKGARATPIAPTIQDYLFGRAQAELQDRAAREAQLIADKAKEDEKAIAEQAQKEAEQVATAKALKEQESQAASEIKKNKPPVIETETSSENRPEVEAR